MKFAPFILITTLFAALVGWFAPGEAEPQAPIGPAAAQHGEGTLAVVQDDAWVSGEVVLKRAEDGHFYAEVSADGATTRMLVDTGASMVALTGDDAHAMGITWNPDEVEPVARGASGLVYGVQVKIDRMQVGEVEARSVDALVVPDGLGISLLGQSFLSRIPRVEMDQQQMILGG
jgi:aspartyl protease family protein